MRFFLLFSLIACGSPGYAHDLGCDLSLEGSEVEPPRPRPTVLDLIAHDLGVTDARSRQLARLYEQEAVGWRAFLSVIIKSSGPGHLTRELHLKIFGTSVPRKVLTDAMLEALGPNESFNVTKQSSVTVVDYVWGRRGELPTAADLAEKFAQLHFAIEQALENTVVRDVVLERVESQP